MTDKLRYLSEKEKKKYSPLKKCKKFLKKILWVRRLMFWIPRLEVFRQRIEKSSLIVQKWFLKKYSNNDLSSQKNCMDTLDAVLTFMREEFWQNPIFFPSMSDNDKKL